MSDFNNYVLATNDSVAIGDLVALNSDGLAVPISSADAVAVVGYCNHTYGPVTLSDGTTRQHVTVNRGIFSVLSETLTGFDGAITNLGRQIYAASLTDFSYTAGTGRFPIGTYYTVSRDIFDVPLDGDDSERADVYVRVNMDNIATVATT